MRDGRRPNEADGKLSSLGRADPSGSAGGSPGTRRHRTGRQLGPPAQPAVQPGTPRPCCPGHSSRTHEPANATPNLGEDSGTAVDGDWGGGGGGGGGRTVRSSNTDPQALGGGPHAAWQRVHGQADSRGRSRGHWLGRREGLPSSLSQTQRFGPQARPSAGPRITRAHTHGTQWGSHPRAPLTSCCASGKQITSVDTQDSTCCQFTSRVSRTSCKQSTSSSGLRITKSCNQSVRAGPSPPSPSASDTT